MGIRLVRWIATKQRQATYRVAGDQYVNCRRFRAADTVKGERGRSGDHALRTCIQQGRYLELHRRWRTG